MSFPASREDLLYAAQRDGGDDETVQALRALSPQTYTSFDQICASITLVDGDVVRNADAAAERSSRGRSR